MKERKRWEIRDCKSCGKPCNGFRCQSCFV